jgi:hypothetical protein
MATYNLKRLGHRRLLWAAVLSVTAALPTCGCSSVTGGHRPLDPLGIFSGSDTQDEALRKQAEADKFPTAQQAGIAPACSK